VKLNLQWNKSLDSNYLPDRQVLYSTLKTHIHYCKVHRVRRLMKNYVEYTEDGIEGLNYRFLEGVALCYGT